MVSKPSVKSYYPQKAVITACSNTKYWYSKMTGEIIEVLYLNRNYFVAVPRDKNGKTCFDGCEYLVCKNDITPINELRCVISRYDRELKNFDYSKSKRVRIKRASSPLAWYANKIGEIIEVNEYKGQYYLCPSQNDDSDHYLIHKCDCRDIIEDIENEIRCLIIWLTENTMHPNFYEVHNRITMLQLQIEVENNRYTPIEKMPAHIKYNYSIIL